MKDDHSIGFLIHRIENRMKANIDARFKDHDLTFSQSQVLFQLKHNDGQLSQKQLQDLCNVSHPTMVGLIQRLESNGFVTTRTDENDKCVKIVAITDKARSFYKDMEESREFSRKRMLKGLDDKQIEEFYSLLEKVYENIEDLKGGKNDQDTDR